MHRGQIVLLADDDATLRNLLRAVLSQDGYKVLTAADGNEALILSRARSEKIDLFLSDVQMPVVDGVSAYRQLRPERPDMKVLFMSGGTVESDLSEAWPFISKPFKVESLLAKVGIVLEGANAVTESNRNVILIVDQNEERRTRTKSILTEKGFSVLMAETIKEADRMAAKAKIDLIISDVLFDNDSGVQLAEREAAKRNTETLLISHCNPATLKQVPGFSQQSQFLHNPFTPEELLTRVRKLLKE